MIKESSSHGLVCSIQHRILKMTSRKVIVFGPTGAVGSAAARTAAELGAKVVLSMRDTNKAIPGLDADEEKQRGFERVQADLTKPDTVREAVKSTGAKYAFIYLAFGMPDNMKSTIEALKAAGIEMVVFLSSFTCRGDLAAIPQADIIPYVHAQVELNLREIYGADGFVALRPGSFASNSLRYKAAIEKGEVKVHMPDATVDGIVPEDIGRVGGVILAKGPPEDQRAIYLYGPKLFPQGESIKILAKGLGKDPTIEAANDEEAYKIYTEEHGIPKPLADYMMRQSDKAGKASSGQLQVFGYSVSEEQLSNVQKYSGKKATTFEEWVEQNKGKFAS